MFQLIISLFKLFNMVTESTSQYSSVELSKCFKNDVRFNFTCSCLEEGSCLIYVICICLCLLIAVSNTYSVVSFCFSSSFVPYVASFSGLVHVWLLFRYSLTFIYIIQIICMYAMAWYDFIQIIFIFCI